LRLGNDRLKRLARFKYPIANHGRGERHNDRARSANHRIDPLSYGGILLEKAWVHKVHASGPSDRTINHHYFAMQTQVRASNEGSKNADLQRRTKLNTGFSQSLRLLGPPPWSCANRVDQQATNDTTLGCPDHSLQDFICSAPGGPFGFKRGGFDQSVCKKRNFSDVRMFA
jgi:hypothetical protein